MADAIDWLTEADVVGKTDWSDVSFCDCCSPMELSLAVLKAKKKPSKLKPGSKSAKRRKSFCARMSGVKGPTSKKGKLTPKGASLKRWNC